MASGASGSTDLSTADAAPMAATPVSRRSLPQAASPGASAKKVARREVVNPPGAPPDTTHIQLVQEVQRIALQGISDVVFFDAAQDAINDHSDCLKDLRSVFKQLNSDVKELATRVASNDNQLK